MGKAHGRVVAGPHPTDMYWVVTHMWLANFQEEL
jgi:hypothetical protein